MLHLHEIFFEYTGTDSPSGADYSLRQDYQTRWDNFVISNNLETIQEHINCFYIGEEPTWNGISFNDLNLATNYVKEQFPDVPIMLVEAYPIIDSLVIPTTVDWFGFDHYFIKDPNTNPSFLAEWELLKTKQSSDHQRMVVIMDSHYIDWAHGGSGGIELAEMKDVATSYYQLAQSDEDVISIIGYFWPNGFDIPESIGARSMPTDTKSEYVRIGKEISGK